MQFQAIFRTENQWHNLTDKLKSAFYSYQKNIENESQIIVGVNKFQSAETSVTPVFRIDPEIQKIQIAKLNDLKSRRDATKVAASLEAISAAAKTTDNLMMKLSHT